MSGQVEDIPFIDYLCQVDNRMEELTGDTTGQEHMDRIDAGQTNGWSPEELVDSLIEEYGIERLSSTS